MITNDISVIDYRRDFEVAPITNNP
jgi:hypothetical protein